MKYLITGTGFIGSHLRSRLVREGHHVNFVNRMDYNGDIYRLYEILNAYRPDVVFHLAAKFLTNHGMADVDLLVSSNVTYTAHLLDAMRMSGVKKIVTAGTGWQHYEGLSYDPVNLYSATKQAGEALIEYYVKAHGFDAITLKFTDTYGPDDNRKKLFNVLKTVGTDDLYMSGGNQHLNLIHVDDVVEGFIVASKRLDDCPGYEKYFLSGDIKSLKEVVALYEKSIKRTLPIIWGRIPYMNRQPMYPIFGPILPGWKANISLEQGIESLKEIPVADGSQGF